MKKCSMKKSIGLLLLVIGLSSSMKSYAQSQEAQQLLLDVEKLAQLKNILKDLQCPDMVLVLYNRLMVLVLSL